MRLPTKPSHTPTSTGILPIFCATAMQVAMTSAPVRAPRTTSSSFITLAGLKKCSPITDSGRAVLAAMSSMFRREVLVARMAPGLQTASSSRNTDCLTAMSSKTASITRSATARSRMSRLGAMRSIRAWTPAASSLPLAAVIS
ncbi:hypothetical protein D3C72_1664050 [compost metagenome]